MAATPSLPPNFLEADSLGGGPLPSISPDSMETYPLSLPSLTPGSPTNHGSGLIGTGLLGATADKWQPSFVLPQDYASVPVGSGPLVPSETPMAPSMPPAHTYPPPRRTSPPSALPQVASASEPRSSFSALSTFGEKGFKTQSQMITMGLEQGPIEVHVDVQAASKVTGEKRKSNATASQRFRQRRKAQERENSDKISKLEAQMYEVTEEKGYYQLECEYLRRVIRENRIIIAPRPPSPRRRQAVLRSVCEI